jgi:O-antigen/teichoic acid export membrane protein
MASFRLNWVKKNADFILNGVSFAVMGLSGILTIVLISKFYDKEYLGIFNLTYSIYILVSQFTGAGIHFSVLRHVSQFAENKEFTRTLLASGLASVTINGLFCITGLFFLKGIFSSFFDSGNVSDSLVMIMPALFFLAVNKVFLAFYNGAKKFKPLATINSLRGITLVLAVLFFVLKKVDGIYLPLILTISEVSCGLVMIVYSLVKGEVQFHLNDDFKRWFKNHFAFGYKSLMGSVFIDVNTRVDVMILGYYATDKLVGIYSYPSMITEGFMQLPILIRTLINPDLTKYFSDTSNNAWKSFTKNWIKKTYLTLIPLGLLIVIAYPVIIYCLGIDNEYLNGLSPLAILIGGCILSAGYFPFLMIFNQTGHPYFQSALYFLIFLSNFLFNILLVPYWGMIGSALGTALSNIAYIFILKWMVKRQFGIIF